MAVVSFEHSEDVLRAAPELTADTVVCKYIYRL